VAVTGLELSTGRDETVATAADREASLQRYRRVATRHHGDALDFELSAGYIRQATRHGFGAALGPDAVTVFTHDPATHRPVIVAAVGAGRAAQLARVARRLADRSGRAVVVKNVSPGLARDLLPLGFRPYAPGECWRPWAPLDDNTFPEQVVATRPLADLVGTRWRRLRNERNQLLRRHRPHVGPRPSGAAAAREQEAVLAAWAARLAGRTGVDAGVLAGSVRGLLDPWPDLLRYEARDAGTGTLLALFAFSPISHRCLAFNALVTDPDCPNAFRAFTLAGAGIAAALGYLYLNLQGSEDRTQDLSKRKLRPVAELSKTHLVLD
jgi:hypothetical protein